MGELTIRAPSAGDQEAILRLLKVGLGEGGVPRDLVFWTWKHLASPFGPSYLLVAEADSVIVGLRAFMRWTWWSGEREVPAVRAVDTVTHPDWRGRGVFTRLTLEMIERVRSEGVAFVFNTPNDKSRPGYLKMGWVRVGRLTPWIQPRRILPRRSERQEASAPPSVSDLLGEPGIDGLLVATPGDRRLTTRPDRAYLRWRYADIPGIRYHAAWSLEPGRAAALVFRSLDRRGRRELRLCEILVAPSRSAERVARRLVQQAARLVAADHVVALAARATPEHRIVRRAGFLRAPRLGPVLTVRPLPPASAPVDPRRRSNWRTTLGALELF
jgi:GNAT superfamily N-acetyltransferase